VKKYWIGIALGALLVFGLGLAGLAAVQKGKAQVRSLLATAATRLPLRFANIGFRLNGRRVGEVTGLDLVRKDAEDLGRITVHVQLVEPDAEATLRQCALSVDDAGHLNEQTSFFCAARDEVASLVEVGSIIFQPGDFSRPLYLPEHVVADWRRSGIQQLDASMARDGRGGVRASGSFDIRDRHRGRGAQRGSFELRADSQGAVMSVRDENNHPLVDFRASGNNLNLNIRDRQGRNLLRLLADSLGAALRVKH